ncbi:Zinc finger protein 782 [Papilio xuthus]|uniref:Zinc finger protein 782 n=1 Tax=Papilio xuthus TaxID=66420 RepID=A0A194PQ43_PAPXU|nr:Zinc finger protein 782 [Papilio xuthus]
MTMNFEALCRLCAKEDEFTKDLLHESNQNLLKLIKEFVHIVISDNDELPTKICLNCEEKMVEFQLFVLECFKVQNTLKDIHRNLNIKQEHVEVIISPSIKSEVKDELMPEDIVSVINHGPSLDEMAGVIVENENNDDNKDKNYNKYDNDEDDDEEYETDDDDDDEDDEYLEDVSIAELKQIKKKRIKRKSLTEEEAVEFQKVLQKSNIKVKDIVKLKCDVCKESFKSWSALGMHYAKSHKSKPLVFCICGFVIRSKSVLYKHVSDHKIESRKFRTATDSDGDKLDDAKYSSLNVKDFINFVCKHCNKECSSWYTLKAHCQREHNTLPFVNCVCGITLKSKSVLYKHVQDHKNPNFLACDKCPRITKTIEALTKHKMRHVPKSERRFCCTTCNKTFNSRETLKSHERSHIPIEERKVFRCELCDLKFTTRSSAASHKRVVHDKIKSYVCDLCGYACGTNGELRQHRAIHSDDKPYVCRKCSKPFKTYSNLKTHMDTHEETSYACYVCSRVLNSRRTLRKHLLVHEDKCRHVCSYCNKAFKRKQTLKVHMYMHTGDKPLTCKWCDERFAYASTLRSHRLRCHADKMAANHPHAHAHAHTHAPLTTHAPPYDALAHAIHQEFMKNDATGAVPKNEVEAI